MLRLGLRVLAEHHAAMVHLAILMMTLPPR